MSEPDEIHRRNKVASQQLTTPVESWDEQACCHNTFYDFAITTSKKYPTRIRFCL